MKDRVYIVQQEKKIRLIDVATKAGVSKSTASQYLNGRYEYMSEETRQKIERAVKELKYIPNPIARSLKTDKTFTIGVIVRDITGFFSSKILRGIDDFFKKHDYNVLIYNTDFDPELEKKSLGILQMLCVDGIIIASSGKNNELINDLDKNGIPIVQMHLEYDDLDTGIVLSDYRAGTYAATEYLIGLGHRNIALITQDYKTARSRFNRYLGYHDALVDNELLVREENIIYWNRDTGLDESFYDLLKSNDKPTAVFSMHLSTTINLLNFLQEHNLKVPEDVSVIGFDDLPLSNLLKVPITVVSQSPYEMGEKSAELLLKKMKPGGKAIHSKVVLPCELIIRESCKELNHG